MRNEKRLIYDIRYVIVTPLEEKQYRQQMFLFTCNSQVHVQNATLAGGVAIGTASNMSVSPWGALLIGCCAGALSTVGYAYLTVSESDKLLICLPW